MIRIVNTELFKHVGYSADGGPCGLTGRLADKYFSTPCNGQR